MLRLLLALALAAPAAGQEPKATATPVCATATVSSPSGDNGCNYGACRSLTTSTMTCQYDSSFCASGTEEWLTAAEVIETAMRHWVCFTFSPCEMGDVIEESSSRMSVPCP